MTGLVRRVMSGRLVVLFPVFLTLFLFAVLVVQIAAGSTGNAAQSGTGKRVLIENGGTNGTGSHANGRARGYMLFLGSAGRKRKGESCENER